MNQMELYSQAPQDAGAAIAQVFRFSGREVRSVMIGDDPWFVAADITAALGYGGGARNAVAKLPDRMKGVADFNTLGGRQELKVINEPGTYRLTMRSNLAEAERFQDWIAEEVIPALRQSGTYSLPTQRISEPDELEVAERYLQAIKDKRAAQAEAATAKAQVAELEPRAAQADHHRKANGQTLIATFCADLQLWAKETHGVKILHDDIRDFLGEIKLIIRTPGMRWNEPYTEATKAGYVRAHEGEYETNTRGRQGAVSARLTRKGWGYAWDKAVVRIATHGQITMPQAVATT